MLFFPLDSFTFRMICLRYKFCCIIDAAENDSNIIHGWNFFHVSLLKDIPFDQLPCMKLKHLYVFHINVQIVLYETTM